MAEAVKPGHLKNKMTSRDRGRYKEKRAILEKMRIDKKENLGETDSELMSEDDLHAADPEQQWSMLDSVDTQLTKFGLDPATVLAASAVASGVDESVALAESKKRMAETEVEEAKRVADLKAAQDEEERRKQAFTADALSSHATKMSTDPLYRAQMLEILTQHTKQIVPTPNLQEHLANLQWNPAGMTPPLGVVKQPPGNGATSSASRDEAQKTAKEIVGKVQGPTHSIGVRRSLPELKDEDLLPASDLRKKSWEEKAEEALELAKRAQVGSATAINIATRVEGSKQVSMMVFLPPGCDPRELSETLLWWWTQKWLSPDYGILWLAARATPARMGLSCELSYQEAIQALNWCSGGTLRAVMDGPTEIGQQRSQFRDFWKKTQEWFAGVRGPQDEQTELILCRPHRRSRQDSDTEDTSDWWSIDYFPAGIDRMAESKAITFVRCEYHHERQWMRYRVNPVTLRELRLSRVELEKAIEKMSSYYLFDLTLESGILPIRSQKQESQDTKRETDQTPATKKNDAQEPGDPWQNYNGKGKAGGKSKNGGKAGGKSKTGKQFGGGYHGSYGGEGYGKNYGGDNYGGKNYGGDSGSFGFGGKSKGKSKNGKHGKKGKKFFSWF